ncbi:MAG: tetratricopeptide repeat protein, partial [Candidatus Cloacimonetes bacterium]|nr:tetratricopeptide repeat protein [Candidatus Cloacimonadota bacterium]
TDAYNNLAVAYAYLGMCDEEIESSKQVLRIDPDNADAHRSIGNANYVLGMFEEAIESYEQALKIDPYNELVHLFLGFAYCNLDDRDSALEEYEILRILGSEWANDLNVEIYLPSEAEFKGE